MGAGNALAAYRQWSGKVTPQELHVLVYIALRTRDDDDTPTWWGGYAELHSRALGRKGNPSSAGAFTGVGKLVDGLQGKGAVTKEARATGRRRVRVALHIAEGRRALAEERAETSNRTGGGAENRSVNLAEVLGPEGAVAPASGSADLENRSVNLAEITQSNRLTEGVARTTSTTGSSSPQDKGSFLTPSPDPIDPWAEAAAQGELRIESTPTETIAHQSGDGDDVEYEVLTPVEDSSSRAERKPRWGGTVPAEGLRWRLRGQ